MIMFKQVPQSLTDSEKFYMIPQSLWLKQEKIEENKSLGAQNYK